MVPCAAFGPWTGLGRARRPQRAHRDLGTSGWPTAGWGYAAPPLGFTAFSRRALPLKTVSLLVLPSCPAWPGWAQIPSTCPGLSRSPAPIRACPLGQPMRSSLTGGRC